MNITAQQALEDPAALNELLQGISPSTKKNEIRTHSFKTLQQLAEEHPEELLPHWNYFADLLKSDNSFSKYPALYLLTALAGPDRLGRFEAIFELFYGLLNDESVMIASHTAKVSGEIARALPNLRERIVNKLLGIKLTHFDPERKSLVEGYALESLDEIFEQSENQDAIIKFACDLLDCPSPKTRKIAKACLKKWGVLDK